MKWTDLSELKSQAAHYFDRPSLSMPTFVNDDMIAVLDDRSGVPQVAVLNPVSGQVSPVTVSSERVLSMHATSDGMIVYGMDVGGNERQQVWTVGTSGAEPRQVTRRPDAIYQPGAVTPDGRLALASSNARDESVFDIVTVDLVTGDVEVWLERAGVSVPVAVSRNGRQALVIRSITNLDADLILIDRQADSVANLTAHEGEAWLFDAAFGPDGTSVWILTNEGQEFVRLERLDLASGVRTVMIEDELDVESFAISPDGAHLAVGINDSGWSRIEIHDLAGAEAPVIIEELGRGTMDRFSWSPDSSRVAFGHSTAEDPSRIVIAMPNGAVRIVRAVAEAVSPATADPELVRFESFDGVEVSGFFFIPEGPGPFPVLIEIHGGPEGQRRLQYSSAVPTNQLIQSLGIAVLALNVRGSTGYGKRFSHLDDRDLRLDSVRDVTAAVEWLRERADVISDRIGVMGQSYGGFMTLAAIAFHPDFWAAAVDIVGIANFVSFLERTGPWRREHRSHEYGFLETDRELLERISPLNSVDQIETPLFVIHGRNDPRVPLFEAEQIVAALQSRDRDVELLVFDDEGHGLSKRHNRIEGYARAAQFLAQRLLA